MESSQALPSGVVTFLLTDIEGSTRLWEREPDAMRQALQRHDAVFNAYVRHQNGHVVKSKGEGDSVFSVFQHVRDAVNAALVIQMALAAEEWATSVPIRVRMAIHTGQIELRDGDYYGPTVNRCARLRALAKGGQVLISGQTALLVQRQLPPSSSLQDLGTHQLKDLSAPERVWQLVHPRIQSLPTETVAPRSAPTAVPLRRAYKLTDHRNCSADGLEWGEGVKYTTTDLGRDDVNGKIRCYTSPILAALLNSQNERFRLPRLWEAIVDVEPTRGDAVVACREVATTRQVPMPTLTGVHHATFAVLCAMAALDGGEPEQQFRDWANGWLAGEDHTGLAARELADDLERQAHRGDDLTHPEVLMASYAARAGMHASRMSWLAGRARDEENVRATQNAAEALRTALRLTRLDLPALAEQAVPKQSLVSTIAAVPTTPHRILRALPT